MTAYNVILALHIMMVILMAAPYYNLVIVNEKARFGQGHLDVDRFFESVIKGILWRCYFVMWGAFILGVVLVIQSDALEVFDIVENWRLLTKVIAWIIIMSIHNYVYFLLQPKIARILSDVGDGPLAPEDASRMAVLRGRRKASAASCFFLVLVAITMGIQILSALPWGATAGLTAVAFVFALWTHRTGSRYGWF